MGTQEVTISYSALERVLAKAFGIREEGTGSLRGRINNFRKLGFVVDTPGTGRKVSYRREHIYRWALGLEFAEFGVSPKLIGPFVDYAWRYAEKQLLRNDGPEDGYQLLCFYPNSLSGWGHYANEESYVSGLVMALVGNLSEVEKRWGKEQEHQHETGTVHYEMLYRRLGMINLVQLRSRIENALANPD